MNELSIIIVSFNVAGLLKDCLKSIEDEIKKNPGLKIEIIVVDNASEDNTIVELNKIIRKNKKIKLIKNKQNLGFAKAVNLGIRKSSSQYILLLNPDTIVKPGALKLMVEFVRTHPLAGVVGGRLLDPDGQVQGSCYQFPTLARALKQFLTGDEKMFQKYAPEGKEPVEVEVVTGGAFLIPRKIINEIGLLDERYFMYFEDLDYCRRVQKAGYKVYYFPRAEFIHYHGASGKGIQEKTHRWLIESSKIYHGWVKYWLITLIFLLSQKWQKLVGKR